MITERYRAVVWKGKYLTLSVELFNHYLRPSCELNNMSIAELCEKITWIISYSVYDTNAKLKGTREWYGLEDGTVVHAWHEISGPPYSLWCYEYDSLERAKDSMRGHMSDDRYMELNLTPVKVAGDVPEEIIRMLEWYRYEPKQAPISEWCPERSVEKRRRR